MSHLLRYLLIFGERKKKVELSVQDDIENIEVETLRQKARELFNLKNVILQIWDKGFEDWVDLDDGDPTPTNSRIRVEASKEPSTISANRTLPVVSSTPSVTESTREPPSTERVPSPEIQVLPHIGQSFTRAAAAASSSDVPGSSILTQVQMTSPQMLAPAITTPLRSTVSDLDFAKATRSRMSILGQRQHVGDQAAGSQLVHRSLVPPQRPDAPSHVQKPTSHQSMHTLKPGMQMCLRSSAAPSTVRSLSASSQNPPQEMLGVHSHKQTVTGVSQDERRPMGANEQIPLLADGIPESTMSKIIRQNNKDWIYNYQLPEFPSDLAFKLQRGLTIDYRERKIILDSIYESVIKHTYYPTATQYRHLTNQLLDKYPTLYNQTGPVRPGDSQWDAWKQKIMHKFKNRRKRRDREIPVVQFHKRGRSFGLMDDPSDATFKELDCDIEGEEDYDDDNDDIDDDVVEEIKEVDEIVIKEEDESNDGLQGTEFHVMPADTTDNS